jgi:hypothetical protein
MEDENSLEMLNTKQTEEDQFYSGKGRRTQRTNSLDGQWSINDLRYIEWNDSLLRTICFKFLARNRRVPPDESIE